MDETSQIQPPPSFAALYADRHGRLKASIADVVGRYELCEDLASHLVEQAQTLYHSGNSSEQGVLLGMHAGLAAEGSIVSPGEARWIVQRLAELLEWQAPLLPDASPLPAPKAQPEGHPPPLTQALRRATLRAMPAIFAFPTCHGDAVRLCLGKACKPQLV